tara:strand:+ start:596 stop:1120 length:525 start_codon:yes stop_codon:yes gene_type:complete
MDTKWLNVGKLVAAQGLMGEIRVNPRSDFPERFTKPGLRWIQKGKETPHEVYLLGGRKLPGKSLYVIKLKGIKNRNQVKELIGCKLFVLADERPKLKKNEFHLLDLMHLEVKLLKSKVTIGKVIDLKSYGQDLIEIESTEGKKSLIPLTKEIVPEINFEEGWLFIDPPDGLLDL